jgi:hypothetical protein
MEFPSNRERFACEQRFRLYPCVVRDINKVAMIATFPARVTEQALAICRDLGHEFPFPARNASGGMCAIARIVCMNLSSISQEIYNALLIIVYFRNDLSVLSLRALR